MKKLTKRGASKRFCDGDRTIGQSQPIDKALLSLRIDLVSAMNAAVTRIDHLLDHIEGNAEDAAEDAADLSAARKSIAAGGKAIPLADIKRRLKK